MFLCYALLFFVASCTRGGALQDGTVLQDDNDDLKFVGNAFQIDPAPSNIVRGACFDSSYLIAILFFLPGFLFENTLLTGLFEEGTDLKQNFIHFVLEQISEGH